MLVEVNITKCEVVGSRWKQMEVDGNRGSKWKQMEVEGKNGSFHDFHGQRPWKMVEALEVEASTTSMEDSIYFMDTATYFLLFPWK